MALVLVILMPVKLERPTAMKVYVVVFVELGRFVCEFEINILYKPRGLPNQACPFLLREPFTNQSGINRCVMCLHGTLKVHICSYQYQGRRKRLHTEISNDGSG